MNTITTIQNSLLKGKFLKVNYRPSESFIISEEIDGGRVIVLSNDGIEYCFDLSDDVEVID